MGKKSLTKSTSKKKATKKKGITKSEAAKTDTAQSKTGKTASPKKGAAKKPTLKSLRKKDFGTWTPAVQFAPQPETGSYTAPPAVETTDKETAKELRALLKKQFETAKPAKKSAAKSPKKEAKPASPKKPAKKAAAKKAPSVKELIKKQFDTTWKPETLSAPEAAEAHYSAPPAIDTNNAEETRRIKALLGKSFDLTETQPSAQEKESEPAKAEETAAPDKEAAAAEKKEKEQTAPKPQPPVAELLARKFETWQPEALFRPAAGTGAGAEFSAPPIADKGDEVKFRELISREFDLSKVTPRPPAEPAEAAPAAGETQPQPEKPAEQEKAPAEKAPEAVQEEARPEPPAPEAPAAAETEEKPESAAKTPEQPPASTPADSPSEKPEPAPAAAKPGAKPAAEKTKPEKKETAEKKKATAPAKSGKPAPKASAKSEKAKQPPQPPSGDGGEPPSPPPGGPQEPREPMSNALKILIIGLAAIFACIILASALNSSKYYIKPGDAGVEIWKGDFSPRGKGKLVTLEDTTMPPDVGEGAVSKQKAYSLPFDYYMQRAEKLSEKDGVPDFEAIREELKKAKKYAVTNKQLQKVKNRLNHIEFTFLLNKADMAAGRNAAEGYEKALEYLQQARELTATQSQREMVAEQILEVQEARKTAEEKPDRDSSANH